MVGKKGRSGRPRKYTDPWHVLIRKHQRKYYAKNREAVLLGMKLNISVKKARKILEKQRRKKQSA